jgi:hypothetical protein
MRKPSAPPLIPRIATHWWLYVLLTLLFFVPSYTTRAFAPQDTPQLVIAVLSHPLANSAPLVFPLIKLVTLAMIALVITWPQRFTSSLYGWVALQVLVIAALQNLAVTPTYGFAMLTGNVIVGLVISGLFAWAALRTKQPLQFGRLPWWRFWVVPLAALSFWFPANMSLASPAPDFSLAGLFANAAGLTFCMMLPVYLALLSLASAGVEPALLRIVGWLGALLGLLNVSEFFMNASYGWWMAILHVPLLAIAVYVFALSFRRGAPTAERTAATSALASAADSALGQNTLPRATSSAERRPVATGR